MEQRRGIGFLVLCLLALPLSAQTLDDAIDLHAAGNLEEAVRAYRSVAADSQTPPEDAAMARNNACVALNDLGDYRAALAECQQALRLYPAIDDEPGLARTLNNTGLALQYLGRLAEAETQFQRALDLNRRHGDAEGQVINLSNLGLVATAAGRYNRALTLHRTAAGIADLAGRNPAEPWAPGQVRVSRINEGVVLEKLGAYREALDVYRLALREESELDPRSRASLRVNVGVVYRNLGDPVRAREAFEEAIRIYEAEGDTAGLSNAWLNVALVYHLNLRQPAKARQAYGEALRFAEQSGDRSEEIQDLFYLGRLLLEQGLLGDAERAFRRCLAAAERSGSAEGRWSALDGLGRIAAAQGDTGRALDHLQRAMDEIERVRASLRRTTLRSHFFGEKRPVYAAAVEILAKLEAKEPGKGHAERALEIAQRAKVRELLDALAGAKTAAPLRAAELQRRLGDGVLLEYFLGETNLFLWVVREDEIRMADLGPAAPLLRDAAEVHRRLSRGSGPEPVVLSLLSRSLLRPAVPLPGSGALRIAPDGALRYLPFEMLPDLDEPERALVDRLAVSYLPSGSVLAWLDRERQDPDVALLGFGAPEIPKTGLLVAGWNLPPLPAAARELGSLGSLLPGTEVLKTGGQATEAAFRRAVVQGARVVHLATHTVVDERPGRGAAVLLTPEGDDDGLLYPEEIAALDYRADLSVLAACRSAVTPESAGGALVSLTGAFLAAGSPAVLATLWDVGDETTAVFMQQLYYELGQGRTPADALALAKRKLREDERWNRPEIWAAYVLIGDGPAVASASGLPRWAGASAVLLAIAVLAAFVTRKWPL